MSGWCRVRGHAWEQSYREPDGRPLCACSRCGLTETWAGGMLMDSTDWRESERLDAKDATRTQRLARLRWLLGWVGRHP